MEKGEEASEVLMTATNVVTGDTRWLETGSGSAPTRSSETWDLAGPWSLDSRWAGGHPCG